MEHSNEDRDAALDWLRAIAVLLVFSTHLAYNVVPGGAVGVSVFFVLSGYFICRMLLPLRLSLSTYANFMGRRLARIYPMYAFQLVMLLAALTVTRGKNLDAYRQSLAGFLTFTNYTQFFFWTTGVLWTLFSEFWFYATFPFVLAAAIRVNRPYVVLAALAAGAVIARAFTENIAIVYYDEFALGAAVAMAARGGALPGRLVSINWTRIGLVLILLAAVAPNSGKSDWLLFAENTVAALGAAAFIMGTRLRPPAYRIEPLAYVGRISFSIYLLHAFLMDAVPQLRENVPAFFAVTILLSSATCFWIEQPFIRWSHRVFPLRSREPGHGPEPRQRQFTRL